MSPVLAVAFAVVLTFIAPLFSFVLTPAFMLLLTPLDLILNRLPEQPRFRARTAEGIFGQGLTYAGCDLASLYLSSLLLEKGGVRHLLPVLFALCVLISVVYLRQRRFSPVQRTTSFVGSVIAVAVAWACFV